MAARSQKDIPSVSAFSEFTASVIISDLIEAVSGQETETVFKRFLEEPWSSCRCHVPHPDESADAPATSSPVSPSASPTTPTACPSHTSTSRCCNHRLNPPMNARGLCEFYRLVGLVLRGHRLGSFPTPEFLNDAVDNHRRIRSHDETLHKQCGFAAGFMTDLADHGYGSTISPDAIGHTGLVGSPFGFYDPKRRLAVAADRQRHDRRLPR